AGPSPATSAKVTMIAKNAPRARIRAPSMNVFMERLSWGPGKILVPHPRAGEHYFARGKAGAMNRKTMLGLTLSAPFLAAGGPARAAVPMESLYEKARAEGALSLYTGGAAANSTALVKAFKARFPGIEVTVNGNYSNITDLKIDRQLRE